MRAEFIHNPLPERMPKSADVVVIGGGPAGAAAAWALEQQQPGIKTVLLEQADNLGSGASIASIENFRTCWPQASLMAMMQLSFEVFSNPDNYLGSGAGQDLNIRKHGYLYVAFTEKQAESLHKDVDCLNDDGLSHIEYLNEAEVAHRYPWLGDGVVAAKFDPHAGWLDSNNLIQRFAHASKGAKFLTGMVNPQIIVSGEKVTGVKTANGMVNTEKVIIAAGAGSRQIGRTAGIEIPVVATPRESFVTAFRHQNLPEDAPFIIGSAPYPYVRPEGSGAIFGWAYKRDHLVDPVWPANRMKDERFPSVVLDLLAKQFRHNGDGFANPQYLRGVRHQAGYYVTRDHSVAEKNGQSYDSERAIIDAWPGIDGLFLSVAHGGHRIMTSPAGGIIAASLLLGQQLEPVFTRFSLSAHFETNDGGLL